MPSRAEDDGAEPATTRRRQDVARLLRRLPLEFAGAAPSPAAKAAEQRSQTRLGMAESHSPPGGSASPWMPFPTGHGAIADLRRLATPTCRPGSRRCRDGPQCAQAGQGATSTCADAVADLNEIVNFVPA